jgi:PAS domain-containing protein
MSDSDLITLGPAASETGAAESGGSLPAKPVPGVDANSHELTATDMYRQYWEEMPCYLSIHDRDYRIIDGNRRFREDFGDAHRRVLLQRSTRGATRSANCPVEATFADGRTTRSEQLADDLERPTGAGDGPHHPDPKRRRVRWWR